MIKHLKRTDRIVRPFTVQKKWTFNNTNFDDLVLLECGSEIPICYITSSDSTSCLNINDDFASIDLALEQQEYEIDIRVVEGIKNDRVFYPTESSFYNKSDNPVNWDGTYKSSIYSFLRKNFYDSSSLFNNFGISTIDFDITGEPFENRVLKDRVLLAQIPRSKYGDTIVHGSVSILDYSNPDTVYEINDDGHSNLILSSNNFRKIEFLSQYTHRIDDVYEFDDELYGKSVDSFGDYIVVGSPLTENSFGEAKSGKAFLYKNDGIQYKFLKEFFSPETQNALAAELAIDNSHLLTLEQGGRLLDGGPYCPFTSIKDGFGEAVAVSDKFLAIGSPTSTHCDVSGSCDITGSGFVYIYDMEKGGLDHWGMINTLEGGNSGDRFGSSVSIDNDTLVIGSDGFNSGSGAVYVYRRRVYNSDDSCLFEATSSFYQILAPEWDFETGQFTSSNCSNFINENDTYFPLYDLYEEKPTPKFISGNNTWVLEQILGVSGSNSIYGFGGSVDVYGDTIVVGCSEPESKVYVFEFQHELVHPDGCRSGSWVQTCTLEPTNEILTDVSRLGTVTFNSDRGFGGSISVFDDFLAIGSPREFSYELYSGSLQSNVGAVYIYKRGVSSVVNDCYCEGFPTSSDIGCQWQQIQKIEYVSDISNSSMFGESVSIYGNRLLVSSPLIESVSMSLYNDTASFENFQDTRLAGQSFIYKLNKARDRFDIEKTINRIKKKETQHQRYASDISLSEKSAVIGSPFVVNYSQSLTESVYLQNTLSNSVSGSVFVYNIPDLDETFQVGNVFYKNGFITITDTSSLFRNIMTGESETGFVLSYSGSHTIYEEEYLIRVDPGEFNVSTNPTATIREPIPYDITGDGRFTAEDVDLILRYINKFKLFEGSEGADNGLIIEQDLYSGSLSGYWKNTGISDRELIISRIKNYKTDESWWNNDIILTESEDVLMLEQDGLTIEEFLLQEKINQFFFNRLQRIDNLGLLDVNGDGIVDGYDASLIWNYYIGKRSNGLVDDNLRVGSTRKYASDIIRFLDMQTGKFNGTEIASDFHNYIESSSIDMTGSYLSPMITTIGLYDKEYNLVGCAKLGRPTKILQDYPINFLIRIDK